LIIWGGYGEGSKGETYLDDMWACDPLQLPAVVWKKVDLTPNPTPSAWHGTAAYANAMWTFGGETEGLSQLNTVTRFQFPLSFTGVESVTVSSLPPLPAPRSQPAAAAMTPGGIQASTPNSGEVSILLFGGLSDGQAITDTLVLTYTVELPPRHTVYLPLIVRSP